MRWWNLFRCELAVRLDGLKDRVDSLGAWVSPDSKAWEQYDEWCLRRGRYDWINEPDDRVP